MSSVVANEAKLVVRLDLSDAQKKADEFAEKMKREREEGGGGPSPEGASRSQSETNPGGDGPGRGGKPLPEKIYDWQKETIRNTFRGGLYDQALGISGSTMGAAGKFLGGAKLQALAAAGGPQVAEFIRVYGPAIAEAGVEAAPGGVPQAVMSLIQEVVNSTSDQLNSFKARIDAVTGMIGSMQQAAMGMEVLTGAVDTPDLVDFGVNMRKVLEFENRMEMNRNQRTMRLAGRAVVQAAPDLFQMVFFGASGR